MIWLTRIFQICSIFDCADNPFIVCFEWVNSIVIWNNRCICVFNLCPSFFEFLWSFRSFQRWLSMPCLPLILRVHNSLWQKFSMCNDLNRIQLVVSIRLASSRFLPCLSKMKIQRRPLIFRTRLNTTNSPADDVGVQHYRESQVVTFGFVAERLSQNIAMRWKMSMARGKMQSTFCVYIYVSFICVREFRWLLISRLSGNNNDCVCSDTRPFGFARLLFRWKGSMWKYLWVEYLVWLGCFCIVTLFYRLEWCKSFEACANNTYPNGLFTPKRHFEEFLVEWENYGNTLNAALTFVLGFYITQSYSRWWAQFNLIPWIEKGRAYS